MISGASSQYQVMGFNGIASLPVANIAADNAVLFLWWVASQPKEALTVLEAWGFEMKTMTGFVWVKRTKHDKPFFGMGFHTRQGSENCLIATRGKVARASASVRAVVEAGCRALDTGCPVLKNGYGILSRFLSYARVFGSNPAIAQG